MPSVLHKIPHSLSILAASAMIAATSFAPANAQLSSPRLVRAVALQTSTSVAPQEDRVFQIAERRRPRFRRDGRRRGRRDNEAAIVGGLIGLATGLIISGAASQRYYDERYYDDRYYYRGGYYNIGPRVYRRTAPPPYYAPPPPVYRERYAVWSPEWYAYCSRKYRSFNPRTGYFLAYSGRYRFCR